jgi:hypothetical protein
LTYKAASCQADRIAAFRLVYQAYLRAGLIEPNRYEMRVTSYQLLPTTDVFLVMKGEFPIATVSLIRDAELGLPCDRLFPAAIERRRRQVARLGEASSLAAAATGSHKTRVLLGLMRVLGEAARRRGIDELLATVHPRHASFYEHAFTFERFAGPAPHRQLSHRPAVGLALSVPRIDAWRAGAYRLSLGARLSEELLEPEPISPREQDLFRNIAAESERCIPARDRGHRSRRRAA